MLAQSIPSARSERTVAARLTADGGTESASRNRPISQRRTPLPSCVSVPGGYPVQPSFDEPPDANAERTTAIPAKAKSQSAAAARPGIAIRLAPIMSGTRYVASPITTGTRTKKTSSVPCIVSTPL